MTAPMQRPAAAVAGESMIDPEIFVRLRQLHALGWGAKRIAAELGLARNTVRAYQRSEGQSTVRPFAGRKLREPARAQAVALFDAQAEGNAVVVQALLATLGHEVSVRTVQRAVQAHRVRLRAAQVATVRYETAPGAQMQIDFGEKEVWIGAHVVRVYLLVAVLGFSRRLFVQPFLSQRHDDWREGIVSAFRRFAGVPATLLCDNASALVRGRQAGQVIFHPAFASFCRDWDVQPRACRPYRARTKGKAEAGVKFVKHNGLAGRRFESFAALGVHLSAWMDQTDQRVHGTTHQTPYQRFIDKEQTALRPLPAHPLPVREQRVRRKVANDALVDLDTVRYSVPHALVRQTVEVCVAHEYVDIYRNEERVARHARSFEPYTVVRDERHYEGLWRPAQNEPVAAPDAVPTPLETMGRSLQDYADVIGGGS